MRFIPLRAFSTGALARQLRNRSAIQSQNTHYFLHARSISSVKRQAFLVIGSGDPFHAAISPFISKFGQVRQQSFPRSMASCIFIHIQVIQPNARPGQKRRERQKINRKTDGHSVDFGKQDKCLCLRAKKFRGQFIFGRFHPMRYAIKDGFFPDKTQDKAYSTFGCFSDVHTRCFG